MKSTTGTRELHGEAVAVAVECNYGLLPISGRNPSWAQSNTASDYIAGLRMAHPVTNVMSGHAMRG